MLNRTAHADPREISSTRTLHAAREAVFTAFSDPGQLVRWWGPKGFTNTFHVFDFSPGGAWRFTMHGPDGGAYPMTQRFIDIAAPERIVYRNEHPTHGFVMTMTLADEGSRTRLDWRMRFDSEDEAKKVRSAVEQANEENFDRLVVHLASR